MSKTKPYEYHISKIKEKFPNIVLQSNNEKLFYEQLGNRADDKRCYFCCECGKEKDSSYESLKSGKGNLCKICTKPGFSATSYNELILLVINTFNKLNINLQISDDNEKYFNEQNKAVTLRKCMHICPKCGEQVKTNYDYLKKGKIWCRQCGNKKTSEALSYSYEEIINAIHEKTKNLGIEFILQDFNYQKFLEQEKMPTKRICYYFCPGCCFAKQTKYETLLQGISYFCKGCSGSINENIFSTIFSDLISKITPPKQKVTCHFGNHKKTIVIGERSLIPDFYLETESSKCIIEYNGRQHYEKVDGWGGVVRRH